MIYRFLRRPFRLAALNGLKPAWISALILAVVLQSPSVSAASFNVREFGAIGDGKTVDTDALQKALDAVATNGGGEVIIPDGHYITGSLALKSHAKLHLDVGAVLEGSANPADYPIVRARWEGIETNCHRGLIWATHADDIAITGSGVIGGNPAVGRLRNPRGPTVVELVECGKVRVGGVTLKSTRMWTLHPAYCHDVQISGVTFKTSGANSDGIDPDSCQRVMIENCTFSTGDDNIAIKSGKGQEGVRIGRPCEDIVITNCTFIKGAANIAFGSELSGGISRVHISHCTFHTGWAAMQLKSRDGRAGYLKDITAEHLVLGDEPMLLITCNYIFNPDSQGVAGADGITQFSNIRIHDVKVDSTQLIKVIGTEGKPVDGIYISQVTGKCKEASIIQNARNVILKDIHVKGVSGPFYYTNNVSGNGWESAAPLGQEASPKDKPLADVH